MNADSVNTYAESIDRIIGIRISLIKKRIDIISY